MSVPTVNVLIGRAVGLANDTRDLQKALTDISNYIYVNDGVLKDRVFSDVVRLIAIKLRSEDDGGLEILEPSFLAKIPDLEADRWARALIKYGVDSGLATSDNAFWSVKETSLLWAARHLSRFSLKDFPADVKGEAFQALVVNNLRGDRGEYFTPQPLVSAISEMALLNPDSRVIDPACGSGGFLYGAYRAGVKPGNLYGLELSEDVARAAKLRVQILGGSGDQITPGDALKSSPELLGEFDAVLMNPPFGSRAKISDPQILESFQMPNIGRGKSGPKALAPELLFLEMAMKLLRPGGRMATVVPDGVLQNSSSRFVREWLSGVADVDAVISCPSVTFQPYGTGVKTSLLVMTKDSGRNSTSTYLGISKSVGYDARGNSKTSGPRNSDDEMTGTLDEDLSTLAREAARHIFKPGTTPKLGKTHQGMSAENRWDAEFFADNEMSLINDLKARGYLPLNQVATLSTSRFTVDKGNGEIGYVALGDLDARTSQVVNVQTLSPHNLPSRATYSVQVGDLITATAGASTGTRKHVSAIVSAQISHCVVSSGFAVLRPNSVSSFQMLGYLRSDVFLRQIRRLRTGHAIPSVADKDLMSVLVPPLSDPIWEKWGTTMARLNEYAKELIEYAESTRGSF